MNRTPNLLEVAKAAGVSNMTVSRVVNNSGKVSDKTRQKVLKAIKELNYQPNLIARSLARKKTNILGLVVYSEKGVHPAFYNEIINGVQQGASELGYDLLIFANSEKQSYSDRITHSSFVDGVIFMGVKINQNDIKNVHEKGFPYVFVGKREIEGINPYFISPDYIKGTKMATEYLIELGHTRIGLIGQSRMIEPDYDKLLGYQEALYKHNLVYNPQLVFEESQTQLDGYNAMKELLKQKPTAVIINNTYSTIGATTAIKEEGLRIPDDISVIGFDDNQELNEQFNDFIGLELSTIRIPKIDLGRQAAKMTISLLEGNDVSQANFIDLQFIKNSSCKKL
ncbi:LacI family DNA-binding transcriptional regulator [Cytobacillus oceanisediminis]|uniref:LacI family transcriptional regulator n=1 Tax=Cytobacillus oceanisediminis TaxID=665099 RepID=A0A562J6T8_9BACI|nr:LacI family DNA-binding transcriptional regulator [Cytobacillus oceanisediminis]TWH78892.1 LacI family transcriptional regulator [Cytobacillus oceanisediminis]